MLKTLGIDAVVDYKQSEADIIAEIVKKTGGKMYRVFDAVAQNMAFAAPMFKAIEGDEKWFTSTNDWCVFSKLVSRTLLRQQMLTTNFFSIGSHWLRRMNSISLPCRLAQLGDPVLLL